MELSSYFEKLLSNIETWGWSATGVIGDQHAGESELPFAYTIGVWQSFGHPELFISGIPSESAMAILNNAVEMVKGGQRFQSGGFPQGVLDGYPVVIVEAPWAKFKEFGLSVKWYYETHLGRENVAVPALQFVWPPPGGPICFPWQPEWPLEWRGRQVLLGEPPETKH